MMMSKEKYLKELKNTLEIYKSEKRIVNNQRIIILRNILEEIFETIKLDLNINSIIPEIMFDEDSNEILNLKIYFENNYSLIFKNGNLKEINLKLCDKNKMYVVSEFNKIYSHKLFKILNNTYIDCLSNIVDIKLPCFSFDFWAKTAGTIKRRQNNRIAVVVHAIVVIYVRNVIIPVHLILDTGHHFFIRASVRIPKELELRCPGKVA